MSMVLLLYMGTFKNLGGRPSKFKKKYIKELLEFFDIEPMRKELMEVVTEKSGKTAEKYKYVANKMPTLVQFAKKIDVDYTTVYRWANKGEPEKAFEQLRKNEGMSKQQIKEMELLTQFCKAYKTAKALQEDFLVQNGLIGASPSSAFIFTAKNVTTMRDKVENEVNVKEVKPLLDNLRKPNQTTQDGKAQDGDNSDD